MFILKRTYDELKEKYDKVCKELNNLKVTMSGNSIVLPPHDFITINRDAYEGICNIADRAKEFEAERDWYKLKFGELSAKFNEKKEERREGGKPLV